MKLKYLFIPVAIVAALAGSAIVGNSQGEPPVDSYTQEQKLRKERQPTIDGMPVVESMFLTEVTLSPESLIKRADVVAVVTAEKGLMDLTRKPKVDNKIKSGESALYDASGQVTPYSVFPVKIDKVIKGDIKEGQSLGVIMPIGLTMFDGQQSIATIDGLTPFKKNARYLVFLSSNEGIADYTITCSNCKINVDQADTDERKLAEGPRGRLELRESYLKAAQDMGVKF